MNKTWLEHYPAGVPADIDTAGCGSLVEMLDRSFERHAARTALRCLGSNFSYARIDRASRDFAAWLLSQPLARGDRVALMLPNLPAYAVAAVGTLRAGMVVVNVNPLAAPHELEHQLRDCGARVVVVLEHQTTALQAVIEGLPLRHVLLAAAGDLHGAVKGRLLDHFARRRHRPPPHAGLPGALAFAAALAAGHRLPFDAPPVGPDDIALLQYTGGTTGPAKGVVLLHRNVVASLLQCQAWYAPALAGLAGDEPLLTVGALPLYHLFGFTQILLLGLHQGGCSLLIPDPRDLQALLKALRGRRVHSFPGVNALFAAVARHPDAGLVDWSALRLAVGGGMAVQAATAKLWLARTGCPISESYGLSEAGALVSCTPVGQPGWDGSIGLPLPGVELRLLADDGADAAPGMPGEIAIRGPQLMAGYWQRPELSARAITADGFFRTGDVGLVDERGRLRIVDRRHALIPVAGLQVWPNEVEGVVGTLAGVRECAAVGVCDAQAGEGLKLVVVRSDPTLTEAEVHAFCAAQLPGHKRPRLVEFRDELPRTAAGRLLRRDLRDAWR